MLFFFFYMWQKDFVLAWCNNSTIISMSWRCNLGNGDWRTTHNLIFPLIHSLSPYLPLLATLATASDTNGHKTPTQEIFSSLPLPLSIQYDIYNLDLLTTSPFVQKCVFPGTVTHTCTVTTRTLLMQQRGRQVYLHMWCLHDVIMDNKTCTGCCFLASTPRTDKLLLSIVAIPVDPLL